jgi:hypothetical protein
VGALIVVQLREVLLKKELVVVLLIASKVQVGGSLSINALEGRLDWRSKSRKLGL